MKLYTDYFGCQITQILNLRIEFFAGQVKAGAEEIMVKELIYV